MYISIEQAIDIYNELIEAKNGNNGFGGDEAAIYVYRLLPNSPGYNMQNTGGIFDADNRLMEKNAAEGFHSICHIFSKKHHVEVFVNGFQYNDWIYKIRTEELRFFDRVIVKVQKNENN